MPMSSIGQIALIGYVILITVNVILLIVDAGLQANGYYTITEVSRRYPLLGVAILTTQTWYPLLLLIHLYINE